MSLHLAHAAHDHAWTALVATVNAVIAAVALGATVIGAQVNDSLLVGALLFVMATGVGIAGWGLVLLVRLSQVVARLEGDRDDHERRLLDVEGRHRAEDRPQR